MDSIKSTTSPAEPLPNIYLILSSLVLIFAVSYLGFIPAQSHFSEIILFASVAFGAYYFLAFRSVISISQILVVGVVVRVVLLFAFPNLSDDIYRFVWDGELTANGMNPYGYLPSDIVSRDINGLSQSLFGNMNSPDYYTIYPPFAQLVFYVSTLAGENIMLSAIIIKLIFIIAEIFTFFGLTRLLEYLGKNKSLVAIYFLNPLILVEGMGNLHFEILMVSFLVWAIYFMFQKDNLVLGALFFTLSIATKLLPLMFLPYFLFQLDGRKRLRFFLFGTMFLLLSFLPIILGLDFANFGSSIDLYFQKFEFNGGIYYALRFLGRLLFGYNLISYIGPGLGLIAIYLIMKKAKSVEKYNLENFVYFAFFAFCTYLFLATTVHPWYLMIPVFLSVFVQWKFALLWSFLIFLTYINYSYQPYQENLWIVSLEYLLVFGMLGMSLKKSKLV